MRMLNGNFAFFLAAHHVGEFLDLFFLLQLLDGGECPPVFDNFGNLKMRVSKRGDLRQMRDQDYLAVAGDLLKFLAGDGPQPSADLSVDLVKNKDRDRIDLDEGFF